MAQAASSQIALVRQARRINSELARLYPDARIELTFTSPLELLVATILSAQATDRKVNEVTRGLFARYRTAADYAGADLAELEQLIQPTGYFHAKAKALIALGQALCERFGGEVPSTLEEQVTLPGVGRKTANLVLGAAFGKPGIVVDTHVARLAGRFGWTKNTDPAKIERDVAGLLPGVVLPVSPYTRPELPRAQPYLGNLRGRVNVQIPHAGPFPSLPMRGRGPYG